MAPHRANKLRKASIPPKIVQGAPSPSHAPHPTPTGPSSSSASSTSSSRTLVPPVSARQTPLHRRLQKWASALPRRHKNSFFAALVTILITIAFGIGEWIEASRQNAQTRIQVAQTARQIDQADTQIKQAALQLCSTVPVSIVGLFRVKAHGLRKVFQNRSECRHLMKQAGSLLDVPDSPTEKLIKRFRDSLDNATTDCISQRFDLFAIHPSALSAYDQSKYQDVARCEKITTAACTFAGVAGWAVRMAADPWWEALDNWSPDNVYWYLGPCFFSVIIISRWGGSARRPNLLPFQILIAIVAFMHSGGVGMGRRRRARERALDDFTSWDMIIIPAVLTLALGIIWAFLLSNSLRMD